MLREPSNRTSMESKLCLQLDSQAHETSLLIEPVWNRNGRPSGRRTASPLSTSNRTSMESKLSLYYQSAVAYPSNRTSMESKLSLVVYSNHKKYLLIEPVWNRNNFQQPARKVTYTSNRTSMESKQNVRRTLEGRIRPSNRTSMESKLANSTMLSIKAR